ncbi:phage tail protein [Marinicrinis sediminis]|uniref:Phage tail protein n=1 Tax=Marinicrinis sediminis TaxID=1652465 RepID=A0ABW5RDY5_9BACL
MQQSNPFFSFNKGMDWNQGVSENLWMHEQGIRLQQQQSYRVEDSLSLEKLDKMSEIAELTVSPEGMLYVLDEKANLWKYDHRNDHLERMYTSGHELFSPRALLAVTHEQLVMADPLKQNDKPGPVSGIVSYSLANGQPLWMVSEWKGEPVQPLVLYADPFEAGILWIFASLRKAESGVLFKINGNGAILKAVEVTDFLPAEMKESIIHGYKQIQLAAGRDRLYLSIPQSGAIRSYDKDSGSLLQAFSLLNRVRTGAGGGFAVDQQGQLYVGYSAQQPDEEVMIEQYSQEGVFQQTLTGYRGPCSRLMMDQKERLYVWNRTHHSLIRLTRQSRMLARRSSGVFEGIFLSCSVDATEAETIWHRVTQAAHIPNEAQIRFSYYTSDHRNLLLDDSYQDLDVYIRNSNIPLDEKLQKLKPLWIETKVNVQDALLIHAKGRYLWFKLELIGTERTTPILHKMRLYQPRQLYTQYLPAIYQSQSEGNAFLDRFLAMFGTLFDDFDERIQQTPAFFDLEAVQGESIQWLSSWIGLKGMEQLEESKLRELLRKAPILYRQRGTREGLEQLLEILLGDKPILVEYFQIKYQQNAELRQLFHTLYSAGPYTFCILLKPDSIRDEQHRYWIEQVIEQQKPAYTEARLIILQPWMHLDMHTYLGMNTFLSEPSLLQLNQQSAMPHHTVIIDRNQDHRLDVHTRLGLDSELE